MQNNPMMMMYFMSQMGKDGSDSGSEGGMNMGDMFKMMSGLDEPTIVESVWEDAVVFGTARDRSGDATIGVLETRVVPPTAEDPITRVRIKTNGPIFARPEDCLKISKVFAAMAAEGSGLTAAYELAQADEEKAAQAAQEKRSQSALMGLM